MNLLALLLLSASAYALGAYSVLLWKDDDRAPVALIAGLVCGFLAMVTSPLGGA
jgi:hypothetical protein